MALQTSGAISFANLQSEFGGSHPITMGEYASFRVSGSGNTISMSQFYGAQSALDTQTVTVGRGYAYYLNRSGYRDYPFNIGSISDGTCNFKSGATVKAVLWSNQSGGYTDFVLNGSQSNSGFTTMTVNGTNYSRTSATFYASSANSYWRWSGVSDPFGTTGTNNTVTWT